jgi:phage major head subunit gpT-like protein
MINGSTIVAAQTLFRTIFNMALAEFASKDPWVRLAMLATEVPSTGPQEIYRWFGSLGAFEEWLGDLNADDLNEYEYTLKNRHFAKGIGVDEDELADDKLGMIVARIRFLAVRALQHRGQQIENLILNGETNLAFDGVAFFANAGGARTIDNLGAGTISAGTPTVAQVEADIDTMRQSMMAFVDDAGERIGLTPTVFCGSAKVERVFRTVMNSTSDPALSNSGASNPVGGWIDDYVVLPRATDLNDVYGLCVNMPVKPFLYQNRQETEQELIRQALIRKLIFKADYRASFGYSLPHLAIKLVSGVA